MRGQLHPTALVPLDLEMEDLSPQSAQDEERKLIQHSEQVPCDESSKTVETGVAVVAQTDPTPEEKEASVAVQTDPPDRPKQVRLEIKRRCRMPASSWGSCILSTLIYRRWLSGEFFIVGGLQIFALLCSIATQAVLIEFLADLADQRHVPGDEYVEECTTATGPIQNVIGSPTWVCAQLLMSYIYANEMRETMSMFDFINQIKCSCCPLQDEDPEEPQKDALDLEWVDEDERVAIPTRGISWLHRSIIYGVLILKIAIALWLAGNSYDFIVFTKEKHEILLNCTATLFILEVDDICFKFVNPTHLCILFENYPSFPEPDPMDRVKWWREKIQCFCPSRCTQPSCCQEIPSRCQESVPKIAKGKLFQTSGSWSRFHIALDASLACTTVYVGAHGYWRFYCGDDKGHEDFVQGNSTNPEWIFTQMVVLVKFGYTLPLLSLAFTVVGLAIAVCCDLHMPIGRICHRFADWVKYWVIAAHNRFTANVIEARRKFTDCALHGVFCGKRTDTE